jgi:hypothetical protein
MNAPECDTLERQIQDDGFVQPGNEIKLWKEFARELEDRSLDYKRELAAAKAESIPAIDLHPLIKQILAMDEADADGDAELWAAGLRNDLTLLIEKHPHLMPSPDDDEGGPRKPSFGVAR